METARAARWCWAYIRRAPGTYIWLAVLFAHSVLLRHVSPRTANRLLHRNSTNLHYLAVAPVRVLITSAFWISGGWFSYFVLYNLVHVPVERRLGTARWLAVIAIAHVGATYLSEGVLYWAIQHGHAPASARYTLDYGVSYALAGAEGVLTYLLTAPWRYLYVTCLLLFYGIAMLQTRDFTSVGHFTAALLGLACYPLTRGRGGPWDPAAEARAFWRRLHRHAAGGHPTSRTDGDR